MRWLIRRRKGRGNFENFFTHMEKTRGWVWYSHRAHRGTERMMFTAEAERTQRRSIFSLAGRQRPGKNPRPSGPGFDSLHAQREFSGSSFTSRTMLSRITGTLKFKRRPRLSPDNFRYVST